MKKKILATVLAAGLIATTLMGCGSEPKAPTSVKADSGVTSTEDVTSAPEEEVEEPAEETASVSKVTLDEAVIYDNMGITVTVTGIKTGLTETVLPMVIQNTTDQNITVTSRYLSVNDYMMDDFSGLYCDIAAGKSANAEFNIYSSELWEAGIDTIANIEFQLAVCDQETWDDIEVTDVQLITSAGTDYVQAVDDSGDVMYDSNGVRIICKGLLDDTVWDGSVVFYMENNRDRTVSIYAENVSVNGFMEDVSLWSDIKPGMRAVEGMTIFDLSDLGIDSIEDISEIELSFRITDEDSWDDIATTDAMTLTF